MPSTSPLLSSALELLEHGIYHLGHMTAHALVIDKDHDNRDDVKDRLASVSCARYLGLGLGLGLLVNSCGRARAVCWNEY